MFILIAVICGGLTILSMIFNAQLGKELGILRGSMINYLVGLFFSLIVVLLIGRSDLGMVDKIGNVPIYALLGGVIGVGVVSISNYVIPKIPTVYTTLIIFTGQIFTGIILDYLRLDELSIGKILGGVLIILGLYYNSRIGVGKKGEI